MVRNVITYYISYTRNNQYLIFYYDQVAGDIIVGFRNICILKATKTCEKVYLLLGQLHQDGKMALFDEYVRCAWNSLYKIGTHSNHSQLPADLPEIFIHDKDLLNRLFTIWFDVKLWWHN